MKRRLWEGLTAGWQAYRDAPTEDQVLYGGLAILGVGLALLLWTPLGNRRSAYKCFVLAMVIHALAYVSATRYGEWAAVPGSAPAERVPLTLEPPPSARDESPALPAVEDPRAATDNASKIDAPSERPPETPVERKPPEPTEAPPIPPVELPPAPATPIPTPDLAEARTPSPTLPESPAPEPAPDPAPNPEPTAAPLVEGPIDPLDREIAPRDLAPRSTTPVRRSLPPIATRKTPTPVAPLAPSPPALLPEEVMSAPLAEGSPSATTRNLPTPPAAAPMIETDPAPAPSPTGPPSANGAGLPNQGEPKKLEAYPERASPRRLDLVTERGGSERTERAVADALRWLAVHQEEDGHWDADGFVRQCPRDDVCRGVALEGGADVGVTGLAVLAFLGAGHTHSQFDHHQETVRLGMSWLLKEWKREGDLRGRNAQGRVYSHAIATLAICEAYAMTKDIRLREPAQSAIDWLVTAQHPESGSWRYAPQQFGDTSVFGWVILALNAGKQAGLDVPEAAWAKARRWLPLVSSGPNKGLAAYRPGDPPSHAMTAEALVCRLLLQSTDDSASLAEAADYLLTRLPDPNDYHLYYWYYGTLSLYQVGGSHWRRWNDRMVATLLDTQLRKGHVKGSWEPGRPFGMDGGRVFTTALSALCLEAYYRYPLLKPTP